MLYPFYFAPFEPLFSHAESDFAFFIFVLFFYISFIKTLLDSSILQNRIAIKVFIRDYSLVFPILLIYIYHRYYTLKPIIIIPEVNGYINTVLTFLTYILCRACITWGLMGMIFIQLRYVMFWFGIGGGLWSPLVRISGTFYQPWVKFFPYCVGGVYDVGPLVGQYVSKHLVLLACC